MNDILLVSAGMVRCGRCGREAGKRGHAVSAQFGLLHISAVRPILHPISSFSGDCIAQLFIVSVVFFTVDWVVPVGVWCVALPPALAVYYKD
jgi:hypothetical protein